MSDYSVLVFLVLSSLHVYGVVIAGWASNSKYALLGSMRAISQMLSYELVLGTIASVFFLVTSKLDFFSIVYYQSSVVTFHFPFLPIFCLTYVVLLAETNRVPFDLPEAEAELVAGYNVEYSSIFFAMFFLAEYCNMASVSCIWVIFFWGGWLPILDIPSLHYIPGFVWLGLKTIAIWVFFVFIRAVLPRYRFDQLLHMGWYMFLPFVFSYLVLLLGWLRMTGGALHYNAWFPDSPYPMLFGSFTYPSAGYLTGKPRNVPFEWRFVRNLDVDSVILSGRATTFPFYDEIMRWDAWNMFPADLAITWNEFQAMQKLHRFKGFFAQDLPYYMSKDVQELILEYRAATLERELEFLYMKANPTHPSIERDIEVYKEKVGDKERFLVDHELCRVFLHITPEEFGDQERQLYNIPTKD